MEFNYLKYLERFSSYEKEVAPKQLFLEGNSSLLLKGIRVSVVGTRNPTEKGVQRTIELTRALVEKKIIVVSGLADGIDTIAHQTCLQNNGKTIAVLGTPLNVVYPPKNKALFEYIKKDHLALSQFPVGYPFQKKNFPMRNRTMALISDATIIVEAGETSGTIHQGWEALRLGRLLLIMKNIVDNQQLSWPNQMVGYGAQVLTKDNLSTILDRIPAFTEHVDCI